MLRKELCEMCTEYSVDTKCENKKLANCKKFFRKIQL